MIFARVIRGLLAFAVVLTALTLSSRAQHAERAAFSRGSTVTNPASFTETKAERDRRMKWWREARFGMFIHWGLYAVPAGEYKGQRSTRIGEWIMEWANIPRADYEKFAPQFNPLKFNAAEWVGLAKAAGMKYIVITSKHHDGFSMFQSDASNYDIVDATPYRKDPIKALALEAKKQGLKFCFYYSILDWHYPAVYVEAPGKDPTAGNRTTKMRPGGKEEYVRYMKAQLRELITKYDPAVLWFDGEWQDWWTEDDGQDLYRYVRSLKRDIIINNRVGKGRQGMQGMNKTDREYSGDFGTPEQQIPANGLPGVDWESCMTMNTTWGYKFYDDQWKSTQTIVRNLIDIASKGGNYLLNVGPTAEGLIPQPSVDRLREVGGWMKANGAAIYGTTASPFANQLLLGARPASPVTSSCTFLIGPATAPCASRLGSETPQSVFVERFKTFAQVRTAERRSHYSSAGKAPDRIATVLVLETSP